MTFEKTTIKLAQVRMADHKDSVEAGERLGQALSAQGLVHVFVISDGRLVNGSELVRGLLSRLPAGVQVTGGLAGDGARFERTMILAGEIPIEGSVGVVGLYGAHLKVGYGAHRQPPAANLALRATLAQQRTLIGALS